MFSDEYLGTDIMMCCMYERRIVTGVRQCSHRNWFLERSRQIVTKFCTVLVIMFTCPSPET